MDKLRVGVIGVGSLGRHHARVFREMEATQLVAICDINQDSVNRVVSDTKTQGYADYRVMLDTENLDIVSVVVPTQLHYDVALEVINRGINVLIEKPITKTLDQGKILIDAANQNRVKLTVGHIERFNPAVVEIKTRLERKELGRLLQIHARRLSPYPARINDVGVTLDLATHDLDVMCYLLNCGVERVYGELQHCLDSVQEDLITGLLSFNNGVVGVLDVNWLTPTKVRELTLLGTNGMYRIDYLTQDVYYYHNGEISTNWDHLGQLRGVREGNMVKVFVHKVEPLRAELESFANAILDNRDPCVSGTEALRVLALAHSLIESASRHEPITPAKGGNYGDCPPIN